MDRKRSFTTMDVKTGTKKIKRTREPEILVVSDARLLDVFKKHVNVYNSVYMYTPGEEVIAQGRVEKDLCAKLKNENCSIVLMDMMRMEFSTLVMHHSEWYAAVPETPAKDQDEWLSWDDPFLAKGNVGVFAPILDEPDHTFVQRVLSECISCN